MHDKLKQLFDLIPLKCNKIFVAGGAAFNFDLAGDVDLWIPNNSIEGALEVLNGVNFPKRYAVDDAPYALKAVGDSNRYFRLIGEFYCEPIGKMVQVLTTPCKNPNDLLPHFDLSIHMHAVFPDGTKYKSIYATTQCIEIGELNLATFGRYIKLSKRYGFKLDSYTLRAYFSADVKKVVEDFETLEAAVPTTKYVSWSSIVAPDSTF